MGGINIGGILMDDDEIRGFGEGDIFCGLWEDGEVEMDE